MYVQFTVIAYLYMYSVLCIVLNLNIHVQYTVIAYLYSTLYTVQYMYSTESSDTSKDYTVITFINMYTVQCIVLNLPVHVQRNVMNLPIHARYRVMKLPTHVQCILYSVQ